MTKLNSLDVTILTEETSREFLAGFQNELDWKQGEMDDLTAVYQDLLEDYRSLDNIHTRMIASDDSFGLQLSNALSEIDRLKEKCNLLNKQIDHGKYLKGK